MWFPRYVNTFINCRFHPQKRGCSGGGNDCLWTDNNLDGFFSTWEVENKEWKHPSFLCSENYENLMKIQRRVERKRQTWWSLFYQFDLDLSFCYFFFCNLSPLRFTLSSDLHIRSLHCLFLSVIECKNKTMFFWKIAVSLCTYWHVLIGW